MRTPSCQRLYYRPRAKRTRAAPLAGRACDAGVMTRSGPADGRFAPSPSGALHLGNLRTALLAWCFARSRGAPFLLRIEDLDPERCRREHEAAALADLALLGIDWDAEPV